MKKILLTAVCAGAMMVSAFAQLLDEKNVTITMDLQPVLQLSLQGPDQIDFTFDNINSYYAGITKYGANILRISASVSFDMWAVGLSQGESGDGLWDNAVEYQGGGIQSINDIPITALELRQFPANPIAGAITCADVTPMGANDDYSSFFQPYDPTTNTLVAAGNNSIYTVANGTPYLAPVKAAATAIDKYIAGGDGPGAGCQVVGGTYLMEAIVGGIPSDGGYFFVMDYRILPGLPVRFPAHKGTVAANGVVDAMVNVTAPSILLAEGNTVLGDVVDNYAAPGVYTMYIKYILVEDQ